MTGIFDPCPVRLYTSRQCCLKTPKSTLLRRSRRLVHLSRASGGRNLLRFSRLCARTFRTGNQRMIYRAYLMENGHTYAAIDLACEDDDEAKQQMANLSNGRDVEVWQGDRKVGLLRSRKRVLNTNRH